MPVLAFTLAINADRNNIVTGFAVNWFSDILVSVIKPFIIVSKVRRPKESDSEL